MKDVLNERIKRRESFRPFARSILSDRVSDCTSFNESEPIVHSPEEELACFRRTQLDGLVIGRAVVHR